MPRAKRREREIKRTREDILVAAARVFARVGYTGSTMQEIAKEAGYTAPSLYTYFEGKEALMQQLFERFLEDLLAIFDRPRPRSLDFAQSLELLLHEALDLCDHRQDEVIAFANVLQAALPDNKPSIDGVQSSSGMVAVLERFTGWLEETSSPGDLGPLQPEEAAFVVYGILNGLFLRWDTKGRTGKLTEFVPRTLDLFFHGVSGSKTTS